MKLPLKHHMPASLPFLIAFFCYGCGNIREPQLVKIDNIRVDKINSGYSTLKLDLQYFNPNKFRVTLKNASGDAWLDGRKLGHFTLDSSVTVPGNAQFQLPVNLEVDMTKVLANSFQLLLKNEVMLKIEGSARISKSGININYPLHYEGKQNLQQLLSPVGENSTPL